MEQLDPANYSGPPMSYREFCLLSEKFKVLCEFSRRQQFPSPQPQPVQKHSQGQGSGTEEEIAHACIETAAFGQGFQNPLYQDPLIEETTPPHPSYPSEAFECNSPGSTAASSAFRSFQSEAHVRGRENAGLSCPSSPAPPMYSPPASSRSGNTRELRRGPPSVRRVRSGELFGDSAKEDKAKGERRWSAASQRQPQERPVSRSSRSSLTGAGSSSGWKF